VVTRDVAPYEIVGGVPARRIRPRYPEAIVAKLLHSSWWEWPPEILAAHIELFRRPLDDEILGQSRGDCLRRLFATHWKRKAPSCGAEPSTHHFSVKA
jgi:hypothetical protein